MDLSNFQQKKKLHELFPNFNTKRKIYHSHVHSNTKTTQTTTQKNFIQHPKAHPWNPHSPETRRGEKSRDSPDIPNHLLFVLHFPLENANEISPNKTKRKNNGDSCVSLSLCAPDDRYKPRFLHAGKRTTCKKKSVILISRIFAWVYNYRCVYLLLRFRLWNYSKDFVSFFYI